MASNNTPRRNNQTEPPSANFAKSSCSSSSSTIGYDHETYLQLISGSDTGSGAGPSTGGKKTSSPALKTPNQVYREERAKHLTRRALDPAILEPRGDPSSVDFECAEIQRKRDRLQ